MTVRNLPQIRKWTIPEIPDFGARISETLRDLSNQDSLLAQQTNSNLNGKPPTPPIPDALTVVPHPNGVQFAVRHDSDFYQGINYEIDYATGGVTHTYDAGSARNGFIPNGKITARYQVRARYPGGLSSAPRILTEPVEGGTGKYDLLPGEGAGVTKRGQPPGFGGLWRGTNPPVRQ